MEAVTLNVSRLCPRFLDAAVKLAPRLIAGVSSVYIINGHLKKKTHKRRGIMLLKVRIQLINTYS